MHSGQLIKGCFSTIFPQKHKKTIRENYEYKLNLGETFFTKYHLSFDMLIALATDFNLCYFHKNTLKIEVNILFDMFLYTNIVFCVLYYI